MQPLTEAWPKLRGAGKESASSLSPPDLHSPAKPSLRPGKEPGGTVSYSADERRQVMHLRWRKNWKVASTMVKGITPHSSTHLEIFILELSDKKKT